MPPVNSTFNRYRPDIAISRRSQIANRESLVGAGTSVTVTVTVSVTVPVTVTVTVSTYNSIHVNVTVTVTDKLEM
jgi:hypothetical protein